jgi:hypothetical protein
LVDGHPVDPALKRWAIFKIPSGNQMQENAVEFEAERVLESKFGSCAKMRHQTCY